MEGKDILDLKTSENTRSQTRMRLLIVAALLLTISLIFNHLAPHTYIPEGNGNYRLDYSGNEKLFQGMLIGTPIFSIIIGLILAIFPFRNQSFSVRFQIRTLIVFIAFYTFTTIYTASQFFIYLGYLNR